MPRITKKKIERWADALLKCQSICNKVHGEIYDCGISDDDMDTLSNMTCFFDEAMNEVDRLSKRSEP